MKTTFASIIVISAIVLWVAALVIGAAITGQQPDTIDLPPGSVVVIPAPDGDGFILALVSGSYRVHDTEGSGCYRLDRAAGTATRIWPFCIK